MTPLFVELCAGLASVSGCLQHGSGWKPPVSRMGRKTGYAKATLRVMGLRPGGKAERFLWAEADGDVAALLAAYTQPEKMRAIAALIRSWIPCPYGDHAFDPSCSRCKGTGRWDARDLWEVLRREERRGLWEGNPTAGDIAGWAWVGRRSWRTDPDAGFMSKDATGPLLEPERQGKRYQDDAPAPDFDAACRVWPPVLIAQDAAVDVGSVAGWAVSGAWSMRRGEPESGLAPSLLFDRPATATHHGGKARTTEACAGWMETACRVWPPTHLTPSAEIPVPPLPSGTVCYIDPPYEDTTGYRHTFPREQVIETALRWQQAGARVYISEGAPIPIPGWYHVEISGERIGQARTFSRSSAEWLTCSVPLVWTPAVQTPLFAALA